MNDRRKNHDASHDENSREWSKTLKTYFFDKEKEKEYSLEEKQREQINLNNIEKEQALSTYVTNKTNFDKVENKVEVKTTIKFKDNLKKNFNLTKYGKMESNISILKIIAILLVVLTHTIQSSTGFASANGGAIMSISPLFGANAYWLHFFQILSIPCVNIFVVISCFLENKSFKIKLYKLLKLYLLITFILLMMTLIKWIIWPTKISYQEWLESVIWFYVEDPWYFTAYFIFLLMVPFVNYLFKKLNMNGINIAFGIVIVVFILWKTLAILFGTSLWDKSSGIIDVSTKIKDAITNRGYNFLNFFVIYVIVQWLIAHNFFKRFKWYGWLSLYVISFGLQYLTVVWTYSNMLYEYSNPLVILSAISLFGLFYNIKVKNNEYVNYFSTLTLTVFLFHWNPLGKTFLLYNQSNSDLGNIWLSNIMQNLLYQKQVFMFGLWVATPELWPVHVLLIFAILSIALFLMAIVFDFVTRLFTAIPLWCYFVNWNKSILKLERFEDIFISESKMQSEVVKNEK